MKGNPCLTVQTDRQRETDGQTERDRWTGRQTDNKSLNYIIQVWKVIHASIVQTNRQTDRYGQRERKIDIFVLPTWHLYQMTQTWVAEKQTVNIPTRQKLTY